MKNKFLLFLALICLFTSASAFKPAAVDKTDTIINNGTSITVISDEHMDADYVDVKLMSGTTVLGSNMVRPGGSSVFVLTSAPGSLTVHSEYHYAKSIFIMDVLVE